MLFQPFYLSCLSHGSYLIGARGQAAVIDPQRDVDQYLAAAEAAGLTITAIIETHLHADFVSGHQELSARTGAPIYVGRRTETGFAAERLTDGDEVTVGTLVLHVLETPGHTPEGISLLVTDKAQPEMIPKLFTGDTLFIGDVGRPDLAGGKGFTPQDMAGMLYDSLHDKILTLPDAVEVYPAHGAGSSCGRAISDERVSTIGLQRQTNYALQPMSREAFIALMTENLAAAPAYFAHNAALNRQGAPALAELPTLPPVAAAAFAGQQAGGITVLDGRDADVYADAHLAGSLNIGLDGRFASWVGTLIPFGTPLLLVVAATADAAVAQQRLARVGYDRVVGYAVANAAEWQAAGLDVRTVPSLTPAEATDRINADWQLLDVRQPAEFAAGHVQGAIHHPVDRLAQGGIPIRAERPTVVICGSGYRSSAAIGLLEQQGFRDLANVAGGMAAWQAAALPIAMPAVAV
ncbi:MAG: MBL fold metallo-hydrolase [Candidatus Sericytochromatia bacterium]|nr:MBL fold metallo-hydrolase [Candidatus Sericytochromatia bacterium]